VWGRKGMFTAIIPEYLDYFKPDFHPWQHDTEFLLHKWRKQLNFA
jgi:predicted metal-dependent hydrolase